MTGATELITLFTTAKALGFDMALVLSMMVIALMLLIFSIVVVWKLTNPMKNSLEEMSRSLRSFTDTVSSRLDFGEKRFKELEEYLAKQNNVIETISSKVTKLEIRLESLQKGE